MEAKLWVQLTFRSYISNSETRLLNKYTNRQKLKVTELKEILAKNHLVQTGKKDELIKRLLDNNVQVGEDEEPELVDLDADESGAPVTEKGSGAVPSVPVAEPEPSTTVFALAVENSEGTESSSLTPEQQAMKARAERFGIPFNPNPKPASDRKSAKPNSSETTEAAEPSSSAAAASKKQEQPQPTKKAGAIDGSPLGLSEEVLARRAAKFGVPEKKEAAPQAVDSSAAAPKQKEAPKEEIDPELAVRIAAEEEKKRKRAEKFGTATNGTNGIAEPDAKKSKV